MAGNLDSGFQANLAGGDTVKVLAVQPDGKILIGGMFGMGNGVERNGLARLDADGALDAGFISILGRYDEVRALALQPDGKVLIGGDFWKYLRRLHADGTLDTGFQENLGLQGGVLSLALQSDGKVLIGGRFTWLNGETRNRIARLNADGTLDAGFQNNLSGASGPVYALALQPDGKVLMGGDFVTVNGEVRNRIARLNADGTLDAGFQNNLSGASGPIYALALQPDGKVLMGGDFETVNGEVRNRIARLNADGTLDTGFMDNVEGADSTVHALAVQPDGNVLIGGAFSMVNGMEFNRVARLQSDGWVDECYPNTFDQFTPSGTVFALTLQSDGKVLIGCDWMVVDLVERIGVVRLYGDVHVPDVYILRRDAVAGGPASIQARATGTPPLHYQWFKDNAIILNATNACLKFSVVQISDSGTYTVRVRNEFGEVISNPCEFSARVPMPGDLDFSFSNAVPVTAGRVFTMVRQPDGKVLIGGEFTTVNGALRNNIARLNQDGTLDTEFLNNLDGADNKVATLAVQPDGKVLIGGAFTSVNGAMRRHVARLNADGTLDTGFLNMGNTPPEADSQVFSLAIQSDGKILIGGVFTTVNGVTRVCLARLNIDGTLDNDFKIDVHGAVYALAVQPDDKALIGGWFDTINGKVRNHIARLNSDGTLDSGFQDNLPGVNSRIIALAVQPDNKVLIAGDFSKVNDETRCCIARLNADGTLDAGFLSPMAGRSDDIKTMELQPDGKVLIAGEFDRVNDEVRNRIARLNADGTLDTGFLNNQPGANSPVNTLAVQLDGKVLIGGDFFLVNGAVRHSIAQLNTDGTMDSEFDSRVDRPGAVNTLAMRPDGRILLGGNFVAINDVTRRYVACLNADGTLNNNFQNNLKGADGEVHALLLQPDGKVLIGGEFSTVNGEVRNRIARLKVDGTLDSEFQNDLPGTHTISSVYTLALQPDGKVLMGGDFLAVNWEERNRIARLNPDGTLDAAFQDNLAGANNIVNTLVLQPDGKVLIGGQFTQINGEIRNRIARLNPDGTLDYGFQNNLSGVDYTVYALALQPDGKVLIGGWFDMVNGETRNRIARLNADGTLDDKFQIPGRTINLVYAMALQPDGKVLLGGSFYMVNGEYRSRIARLNSDGTLDADFQYNLVQYNTEGVNDTILTFVLQSDGNLLMGGLFTTVNGVSYPGLARLTNDAVYQVGQWVARPSLAAKTNNYAGPVNYQPNGPFYWDINTDRIYFNSPGSVEVIWNWWNGTEKVPFSIRYEVADIPAVTYEVGQTILPPYQIDTPVPPEGPTIVTVNGSTGKGAVWHAAAQKLYATSPGAWMVYWTGPNTNTGPQVRARVNIVWPSTVSQYQTHVAHTPPVDLTNGTTFSWAELPAQDPGVGAGEEQVRHDKQFSATGMGRSVVVLAEGDPASPSVTNVCIQLIETVAWNDPAHLHDHVAQFIGAPITNRFEYHTATNEPPFLFNALSRYCTNLYSRDTRRGPIIPVNRDRPGRPDDDMVIVYYQFGQKLYNPATDTMVSSSIAWPWKPVRYDCQWPPDPAGTIVVASEFGSGPVPLEDGWQIYRQPDPSHAGYNPNEEHANKYPAKETAGRSALQMSLSALTVLEGGKAQLEVKVLEAPTNSAVLSVSSDRLGDNDLTAYWQTAQAKELKLTNNNYAGPHLLIFTNAPDGDAMEGTNTFTIRLSGDLMAEETVAVYEADTNALGLVISPRHLTVQQDTSKIFTIRLTQPPASPVSVQVTQTTNVIPNMRLVGATLFTFTSSDWNQERSVTLEVQKDTDYFSSTNQYEVKAVGALNELYEITVVEIDLDTPPEAIFALRDDLGDLSETTTPEHSEPYVLAVGTNAQGQASVLIYRVKAEDPAHNQYFHYSNRKAGRQLQPFYPLSTLPDWYKASYATNSPAAFQDRKQIWWAKAAGDDGGHAGIVMKFFYPVQSGFDFPRLSLPPEVNTLVPLLDQRSGGTPGIPTDVTFDIAWPDNTPELRVGETLVKAKFGLPSINDQSSVDILYEQSVANKVGKSVELIDPTWPYSVPLDALPGDLEGKKVINHLGHVFFAKLPPHLRGRMWWEPPGQNPGALRFKGEWRDAFGSEEPRGYLLLNVISERDRTNFLLNPDLMSQDPEFIDKMNGLCALAAQARQVQPNDPFDSLALTAGLGRGTGYVTLAFNNAVRPPNLQADRGTPVSLEIIKVTCPLYRGEIKVINPDDPFDERLTLRHTGDFAGRGDDYVFQWKYWDKSTGSRPPVADQNGDDQPDGWSDYPMKPPDGRGALDAMVEGSGIRVLKDFWYICHYCSTNPLNPCGTMDWSEWTPPAFAEGWIKRVQGKINPFDQKLTDYSSSKVDTIVNMISQAGARSLGSIPLNQEALMDYGLIEIYETVLKRGIELSLEAGQTDSGVNKALMGAARNLADLYTLLGNEAYADAADPTIGFGTTGEYANVAAPSIHCFMDQTASLLDEELALLRGISPGFSCQEPGGRVLIDVTVHPAYNRLRWNFTRNFTGGEVAYALNYNIRAFAGSTNIDAVAAQNLFPQGHGDAWGHYLTALKNYCRLIQNKHFDWNSEIEYVTLGGIGESIPVNYMDERKFASIAAAKAQTGVEIVNLTYRKNYVDDVTRQWEGYADPDTNRAWGVWEWASRAGQGALFDWVLANALLPAESDGEGIQKVDRTTVLELRDVAAAYVKIQEEMDKADQGLNPLGLAKGIVPFDINTRDLIERGQTHFEQILARARTTVENTLAVFNYASVFTQELRKQADDEEVFRRTVVEKEADYNNRLIEIFGYPYLDDLGALGSYPNNPDGTPYDGPDLYHYMYVEPSRLLGTDTPSAHEFEVQVVELDRPTSGNWLTVNGAQRVWSEFSALEPRVKTIKFHVAANGFGFVKPSHWRGQRRAPGQIQMDHMELLQAKARLERAMAEYENLLAQIEDQAALLHAQYDLNVEEISVLYAEQNVQESLNVAIRRARTRQLTFNLAANKARNIANALAEGASTVFGVIAGMSGGVISDPGSFGIRQVFILAGLASAEILNSAADRESLAELDHQQAKELAQSQQNIRLTALRQEQGLLEQMVQLEQLVAQEASHRLELYSQQEAIQQAAGKYAATLASGQRLLEERLRFRQQTAEQVQSYRYKDMAFRIFRNDALQKYRAQFDLAARYVFLAAIAYDYDSNLPTNHLARPSKEFFDRIVRARTIGWFQGGQAQTSGTGDPGLGGPMAELTANFAVLKSQLGLDQPSSSTVETKLRYHLFRILPGSAGNTVWREELTRAKIANLNDIPEVRRHCIFPYSGVQSGMVFSFNTSIGLTNNLFGWPAGGGDFNFNPTEAYTKIRSIGIRFENYRTTPGSGLYGSPRAYLIPIGVDVIRCPQLPPYQYAGDYTRDWQVLDQWLPTPFSLSTSGAFTNLNWIPWLQYNTNDFQLAEMDLVRRHKSMDVWYAGHPVKDEEADQFQSARLIGRSVWNTSWLLIIPGVNLLPSDPQEGLERFINGQIIPGTSARDLNGISDIVIRWKAFEFARSGG